MNSSISQQLDQQTGVDIRASSSAIFGISSSDRYPTLAERNGSEVYTSPYTATISSNQSFIQGSFTRIALTEVVLRWTLPTFTFNNRRMILRYQPGGAGPVAVYNVFVPIPVSNRGWYTPTTLAAAVQTAVRTLTGNVGFTVTSNATAGYFYAESNNGDEFQFRPYVIPTEPNRVGLFEMMNWPTGDPDALRDTYFSGTPTMLRTQFVDIVCSQLTGCQGVKDADTGTVTRDVLCRLYLNDGLVLQPELLGSEPFTLHRQFVTPKQIKWLPNTPVGGFLQFQVYDDQGYIITSGDPNVLSADFDEIGDWNLTLQLSEN